MTTNFTDISTDIVYLGNLGNQLADVQNFSPGGLATRTELLLTKTIVTDNGTNYTVTAISNNAFQFNFSLQSVDFSGMGELTSIGNNAFLFNTNLTEIKNFTNATKLETIGIAAFADNLGLQSFNFGGMGQLTHIGGQAFNTNRSVTELKNFTNATNLRSIGNGVFGNNDALQSVDFGGMGQLTSIENKAFSRNESLTELKNFTKATKLQFIGDSAFEENTALKSVDFGGMGQLTSISAQAFLSNVALTELKNFTNATKLQFIGQEAFYENYALQSVDFGGMGQLTSIGDEAFYFNTALTELKNFTNATKLLSIGDLAFTFNSALQSVDFGGMGQLTSIGFDAFFSNIDLTELKNFTNATNLLSIGDAAFSFNFELQSVDFGGMGKLTSIGDGAFGNNTALTELKNFTNATKIKSFGLAVFALNYALQSVDFGGMGQLTSIGELAFGLNTVLTELKNFTNAVQLKAIGDQAFYENKALKSVDFGGMGQLTSIGIQAFYLNTVLTELKNLTNATKLQFIGASAFSNNIELQSVDFGGMGKLTSIESNAFELNTALITLNNFNYATSLNIIKTEAFYDCYSIQTIFFPKGLTRIRADAFYSNISLRSITFNDPAPTSISTSAFADCSSLESIYHYGTNTSQLNQLTALANGTLYDLTPDKVTVETYGTHIATALDSLSITNELQISDIKNIYAANLIQIALNGTIFQPETNIQVKVGAIPFLAEQLNASPTDTLRLYPNYTTPTNRYSLGSNDGYVYFQMNLGSVLYLNTDETITKNADNTYTYSGSGTLYQPGNNITIGGILCVFGGFGIDTNTIEITDETTDILYIGYLNNLLADVQGFDANGATRTELLLTKTLITDNGTNYTVTAIRDGAFSLNYELQSVDFGGMGQLTSIGNSAFYNNTALTELKNFTNATKLQSIGNNAFLINSSLKSVDFGGMGQLTSIGLQAFYYNTSLTELKNFTSATNLLSIGYEAFSENYSLQSVDFSGMGQLTSIGEGAFYLNTALIALNNFNYATSLKTINESVFYNCTSIQTIFFPSGLTEIQADAFYSNISLKSITFNDPTPTSIAANAFANCTSLKSIYHYGTDTSQLNQLTSLANGTLYDLNQDKVDYADYATYISSAFDNSGIEDPLQISDIKNTYAENLIQVALNGTIFDPFVSDIQVKLGSIPFVAEQLDASPTDTLRLYPNYTTPNNRYIIASNTDTVYIQMFLGSVLYLNTNETITKNADNTYTYSGTPSEVYQPGDTLTIGGRLCIFGGVLISGGGGGGNNSELGGGISGISPKPIIIVERGNERGANRQILRRAGFFNMNTYTQENPGNNVNYILDSGIPVKNKTYLNKDSSDRTRKLKLKAQNKTYNDPSFGGNDSNGAYSALAKLRH